MSRSSFAVMFTLAIVGCAYDADSDEQWPAEAGKADSPAGAPNADRYIVKFKSMASIQPSIEAVGGSLIRPLPKLHASAVQLDRSAAEMLRQDPNVEYVEVDGPRYPFAQRVPYGVSMVQGDLISPSDTANRTVCIIDTGLKRSHEDHQGNPNITGTNVDGTGNWYDDSCGHGTHVAGTIAAVNNTIGVVGVAPGMKLHIIKVFDGNLFNCEWAYTSELINAMQLCNDAGANIISMSLGGPESSETENTAIQALYDSGTLIIAAAGNDGDTGTMYPAGYPSVLSVAAVDSNKAIADFSQRNDDVELAAPGVDVQSTVPWFLNYSSLSGTSMACPHVSGVAALIWSYNTNWTNAQVRQAMIATAEDLGPIGRDSAYGYGLVQAQAALRLIDAAEDK
jgi:serine protease